MSKSIDGNTSRKLLKKALQESFPGVNFSVKNSGGGATDITWTDGPTVAQLDRVADFFEGQGFDGMTDCRYSKTAGLDGESVHFGTGLVLTSRNYSEDLIREAIDQVFDEYAGNLADYAKPAASEYRAGSLWHISTGVGDNLAQLINIAASGISKTDTADSATVARLGPCPVALAKIETEAHAENIARQQRQEAARQAAEVVAAPPAAPCPAPAVGDRVDAVFAALNKNCTLSRYLQECLLPEHDGAEVWDSHERNYYQPKNWYRQSVKILHVYQLTAAEYDQLSESLMDPDPQILPGLAAFGGGDSDYQCPPAIENAADPWAELYKPENAAHLQNWRAEHYLLGAWVTAPGRKPFVIDSQGYEYARYVGLPPVWFVAPPPPKGGKPEATPAPAAPAARAEPVAPARTAPRLVVVNQGPAPGADPAAAMPAATVSEAATVTLNPDKNGVEVTFPAKPPASVRDQLKAAGFRWSRRQGLWYAKQNPASLALAQLLHPWPKGQTAH